MLNLPKHESPNPNIENVPLLLTLPLVPLVPVPCLLCQFYHGIFTGHIKFENRLQLLKYVKSFDGEIDTELSSGLFGGPWIFYGLFPKRVEHPCCS